MTAAPRAGKIRARPQDFIRIATALTRFREYHLKNRIAGRTNAHRYRFPEGECYLAT